MKKTFFIVLMVLSLSQSSYAQPKVLQKDAQNFLEDEKNSISVFQKTVDSVVNVSNIKKARRGFFDMDPTEVEAGVGSGFIWDKLGHVVTNFHVVDGGDSFMISFKNDKKQYRAKFVGADPKKDIAVLKLEEVPATLNAISVGESKSLLVGQKALAIGNPLGLDHTLTTGTVSALERKIRGYGGVSIHGMIQTDASINPGNSGGPLLDSEGRLIGINTMIFNGAGVGSNAGLGFAIPVDTVKSIVPQLIKYGKVIRPGLGIAVLEEQFTARFGIRSGVMIKYIDPNGPAKKAGLQGITRDRQGRFYVGDLIIGIDSHKVESYDDLYNTLDKFKIGDQVKIKFIRNNKEQIANVTLQQL